jgi:hypothetical protein
VPQQVLEENLGGEREARHTTYSRFFEASETKAPILRVTYAQLGSRAETVLQHGLIIVAEAAFG